MTSLMSSDLIPPESDDEIDPISGVANLADAMLVFACGLILALIGHYNVDLSNNKTAEYQPLDGSLSYGTTDTSGADSTYTKLGMVYKDDATGKMYLVSPDSEDSASDSYFSSVSGTSGHESAKKK